MSDEDKINDHWADREHEQQSAWEEEKRIEEEAKEKADVEKHDRFVRRHFEKSTHDLPAIGRELTEGLRKNLYNRDNPDVTPEYLEGVGRRLVPSTEAFNSEMQQEPEPVRFEAFAGEFQRTVTAYFTEARGYYGAMFVTGAEIEPLRDRKDQARIELETVAQDVLQAIARERAEMNGWINEHAPFGLSPAGDTLDATTLARWSNSVDRLDLLDNLEAFLAEHGLVPVPNE